MRLRGGRSRRRSCRIQSVGLEGGTTRMHDTRRRGHHDVDLVGLLRVVATPARQGAPPTGELPPRWRRRFHNPCSTSFCMPRYCSIALYTTALRLNSSCFLCRVLVIQRSIIPGNPLTARRRTSRRLSRTASCSRHLSRGQGRSYEHRSRVERVHARSLAYGLQL